MLTFQKTNLSQNSETLMPGNMQLVQLGHHHLYENEVRDITRKHGALVNLSNTLRMDGKYCGFRVCTSSSNRRGSPSKYPISPSKCVQSNSAKCYFKTGTEWEHSAKNTCSYLINVNTGSKSYIKLDLRPTPYGCASE
jgi:hypothetical protein